MVAGEEMAYEKQPQDQQRTDAQQDPQATPTEANQSGPQKEAGLAETGAIAALTGRPVHIYDEQGRLPQTGASVLACAFLSGAPKSSGQN